MFRFAIPAAFAIALGTALSYVLALEVVGIDLEGSRTVALAAFVMAFLYMIFALEATDRRRALWVAGLCVVLGLAFWVALAIPLAQDVFDVVFPDGQALGLDRARVCGLGRRADPGADPSRPPLRMIRSPSGSASCRHATIPTGRSASGT